MILGHVLANVLKIMRNATISFFMSLSPSSRQSVRLSVQPLGTSRLPLIGFREVDTSGSFEHLSRKFKFD
jgi:hypothetical protein